MFFFPKVWPFFPHRAIRCSNICSKLCDLIWRLWNLKQTPVVLLFVAPGHKLNLVPILRFGWSEFNLDFVNNHRPGPHIQIDGCVSAIQWCRSGTAGYNVSLRRSVWWAQTDGATYWLHFTPNAHPQWLIWLHYSHFKNNENVNYYYARWCFLLTFNVKQSNSCDIIAHREEKQPWQSHAPTSSI